MKKSEIRIIVEDYLSAEELPVQDRQLLAKAITAASTSYSPYSSFRVGAAVRLDNGEIITASNQENAAYPSGLCAERVALFYAQANYPESSVTGIAIYAESAEFTIERPVTPCGSCRQVMAEHEYRHGQKMRIIMGSSKGNVSVVEGIESLLPMQFVMEGLRREK